MPWLTFGTQTSPLALSKWDTQFGNVAQWAMIDTAATGTNAITLAPTLSGYSAAAYANYVTYRFVALNNSSGAVTLRVSALAFLKVFGADNTTQMASGSILAGRFYLVTYNSALDSAAGGWTLTPLGASVGSVSNPVLISEGGTSQVTAGAARGSSGLNIDQATSTSFNADSSISASTRTVISSTTAMGAGHTLTLPAASSLNAGQVLEVLDLNGVTGAQTLTIQRAGSDTINGTTSVALATAYAGWSFKSDGTSKWSANFRPAASTGGVAAGNGISVSGSTVSINTNNSLGIGAYAIIQVGAGAGTVTNGATAAGANLQPSTVSGGSSPASLTGQTWRNVSGLSLDGTANDIGLFIRTA